MLQRGWVGRRVSVRRVVERAPDGHLLLADVVGDLVGLDSQTAVVQAREGLVEVPVALVTAARLSPPSTRDELALEAVAAKGWRAADTEQLDGWLLRADHGFTSRANSVLPLRQLHRPLDDALAQATAWYAARGLPLRIAVPVDARRLLDAGLAERGWPTIERSHVLTGRLDLLPAGLAGAGDGSPQTAPVELAQTPDNDWLACYRGGAGLAVPARELLIRHPTAVFAAVRIGGRTVATGRGCVDDGWLGIAAVEVDPPHRRAGLATAVTAALWAWGSAHGAVRSYLQVAAHNTQAVALYARLGYHEHHDYHYRRPNDPSSGDAAPQDGPWSTVAG